MRLVQSSLLSRLPMNLKQRDRRVLARESNPQDIELVRTDGAYVHDRSGKRYIDFVSAHCVGNFGWGEERLRKVVRRAKAVDYVNPEFLCEPWVELAELLAEITPGRLQRCYRATGGSEAVEIALMLAMASTKRKKFVSVEGSYHGNTIGAVSVASSDDREPYPNLLGNTHRIPPPLNEKAADRVERLLKNRDVAAVILEPIATNIGVLIPDAAFMKRVSAACRKYGTLFIADEVACGFGRTGALFASEHFDLEPDILCMGKAITGGYAPMGATIATAKIADSVKGDVGFHSTYGWHPLSTDVAIANVRWILRNRKRLLTHVAAMSDYFRSRLEAMEFEEVRVTGLVIGVDTGDKKRAESIVSKCQRKGLLVTTSESVIAMFPPLTIENATAIAGLDIFSAAARTSTPAVPPRGSRSRSANSPARARPSPRRRASTRR